MILQRAPDSDEAFGVVARLEIEVAVWPTPEVQALVQALDEELSRNYRPEQRHAISFDSLFHSHVRFLVARLNGEAAGCGGIAFMPEFAEVKRMYVRPEFRSRGIADALMARLIAEAQEAGFNLLRLETGTEQAAAIGFYSRSGFTPCPPFQPYSSMPAHKISTSFFMERDIGALGP